MTKILSSSYLELLRENANFRNLWYGQVISLFGDWFNLIASAALVADLTNSGLAIGGLFAVRMLAPFLVSPFAGVAADRYNRKHLLVLSDLARALTVVGFFFVRSPGQVWLLYSLTAIQLGLSGLFFPTRNAILPDIVRRDQLGPANTISSATWSVMLAMGAALGGLVAGAWGIYTAFAIDAISFLISAWFIARIGYQKKLSMEISAHGLGAISREYLEGLKYLRRFPDILAITLHKAVLGFTIAGGVINVAIVAIAGDIFVIGKNGGTGLGLLYGIAGLGTGLGPFLARRFAKDRDRPMRTALSISYFVAGTGVLLSASLINFESVMLGMFIRACGVGVIWVFSTQLLLQLVPDYIRGRVFSVEFALFTLTSAASAALAGWILDRSLLSLSQILIGIAVLSVLGGMLWVAWNRFRTPLRSSTDQESAQVPDFQDPRPADLDPIQLSDGPDV
jgi:MFS family permease